MRKCMRKWREAQCYNFHFGPHVYCLHGVAHLRKIPHVSTTFGKKWIHGVSGIYTSGIHYVSDTPRVSSGYPMYPYVSLCIPMYPVSTVRPSNAQGPSPEIQNISPDSKDFRFSLAEKDKERKTAQWQQ